MTYTAKAWADGNDIDETALDNLQGNNDYVLSQMELRPFGVMQYTLEINGVTRSTNTRFNNGYAAFVTAVTELAGTVINVNGHAAYVPESAEYIVAFADLFGLENYWTCFFAMDLSRFET